MQFTHQPVLLSETLRLLDPQPGEVFVDGTVGGGGHSKAILERILPRGKLLAIDRDSAALKAAEENLGDRSGAVLLIKRNFADLSAILRELNITAVDGILFDLGVSSYQLDKGERGFSFHNDASLDMRMDRDSSRTAADLVNNLSVNELTRIIRDFGEELWAERIAKFIAAARAERPIETTGQLVKIIKAAIPAAARRRGPHPARRTFQALRIAVNDELANLEKALRAAISSLRPGGRLAVISFHSLEDRIVKKTLLNAASGCECPPGLPQCVCHKIPQLKILTRKPVRAGEEEVRKNPRARSAKLRAAMKVLNERKGE